ncbi:MAG: mechanosensitive ion channel family protein [Spirochaetes bacterium]|nr:mechanosensitive ion channel family protein [Spirochaetota bacterium]
MSIDNLKNKLSIILFNNTLSDYSKAVIIILSGILIIWIIKRILIPRLQKIAVKAKSSLDEIVIRNIAKQLYPALYFTVIYLSLQHLVINNRLYYIIKKTGLVIIIISMTRFITTLSTFILKAYVFKNNDNLHKENILSAIKTAILILCWTIALIIFLDNIGIKITGLVTGLGIGGVAVAFAAQAMLKDIFSYFSIFLDKPFEAGDFIIVDKYMGTVEQIGIKTTRIKSLSGEQLIFSNADLTDSRVRNFKRMEERRVVFTLGVTYETPVAVLKEIPDFIKKIIEEKNNTRFDRCHFSTYGDFNLVFETVYYVNTNDYNVYMDTQEYINLRIKEEFEEQKIEFAYPTQLLYMDKKV